MKESGEHARASARALKCVSQTVVLRTDPVCPLEMKECGQASAHLGVGGPWSRVRAEAQQQRPRFQNRLERADGRTAHRPAGQIHSRGVCPEVPDGLVQVRPLQRTEVQDAPANKSANILQEGRGTESGDGGDGAACNVGLPRASKTF